MSVVCLSPLYFPDVWAAGSKRKTVGYTWYRMHSLCFLMKTRLRHPQLPPGQRQLPMYTRPFCTKNLLALTLGKIQRGQTDRRHVAGAS